DRKYLLPLVDVPAVLGSLPADTRVLEIAGRRAFGYRSVYFDTPVWDSYRAAARRRRRRFKIRIRSYLDSDLHFLEIKTRSARGATIKERVRYGGDGELGPADREYADPILARIGLDPAALSFAPALLTRYQRSTLFVPRSGSRVTVDTDLVWTLPHGPSLATADRVVVETKSTRAASEVDRLLWSLGHRPCAISKYATGLAALRPELPANRWHRLLRRHLHPVTRPERSPS
ncbi:MAG: polyphosphate polymerase domain-containing protein, partial [Actinomycetes bacterium]